MRAKLWLTTGMSILLSIVAIDAPVGAGPTTEPVTTDTEVTVATDVPADTEPATDVPVDTEATTTTPAVFPDNIDDGDKVDISDLSSPLRPGTTYQTRPLPPPPTTTTLPDPTLLPANSGAGRRAVYSKSTQRVWAVADDGTVLKTHRVSGKLNWCDPKIGTYAVWSRSRHTYAIQNPTIKWGYMIRFTQGCNGGNIGFHEIPVQYGAPVQTIAQLGQPLSGGCVRQAVPDAIWMWEWAQIGTKVVVLP